MKLLVTIGLSLCLLTASPLRASAHYQDPVWLEVSPAGEAFRVLMPNQPRDENETVGAVSGKRYAVLTGVASYTIWSLTNANYRSGGDVDQYLDAAAELVWEGLLKPARDKLDDSAQRQARITYVRDLPPEGLPGREYTLTFGAIAGTAEFLLDRDHVYVLLAMGQPGGDWPREKFFASFRTANWPVQPTTGNGLGPGLPVFAPSPNDNNQIFSGREVTQKARVLEKPEPTYSESARKFGVQGTVVLRCVFANDGKVTNIHVVRKAPHGLTQNAIAAARAIRFTPAMKEGQAVSMWMELQYNFNLY